MAGSNRTYPAVFNKQCLKNEGALLVISGPHMDFKFKTHRLEYISKDKNDCEYLGLRKFMEIRKERDKRFGEGISEDYFHPTF